MGKDKQAHADDVVRASFNLMFLSTYKENNK